MNRKAMREKIDSYYDTLISINDMLHEKATEQEEKFIFAVNEMRHYGETEYLNDGTCVDYLREAAESMAECESSKLNRYLSCLEGLKYKGAYIPENIKEDYKFIKDNCGAIKGLCENLCNIADFLKDEYSKELGKNEIEEEEPSLMDIVEELYPMPEDIEIESSFWTYKELDEQGIGLVGDSLCDANRKKIPTEEDLLNMLYPKEKEVPELCECIQKCKDEVTFEQMLDNSKHYDYDAHDDFDDFDEI